MRVTRYGEVDAFLERARPFLEEREAEHNLILGLSSQLLRNSRIFGEDPYLAVVEVDGDVRGVVFRTPPHNLVLSELDDERAIGPIVTAVREEFDSLPGVVGPKDRAAQFAAAWEAATGAKGRLELAQRTFCVDRVEPPQGVPGRMRGYEPSDRELACRWMDAFAAEALPESAPHPESSEEFVDRREEDPDGGLVLWEDGEAVSIAGYGGPTPNGIRIGPVYTPPELRGRGYGSAVTAALTQQLLDGGRRFCFLFTDLANPTSNSIYQRIGYRPVSDVDLWVFSG
jgi:RimJ/RimL family protein N-acetyltransferase